MTLNFSAGEATPDAVLAQTEEWLTEAAQEIAQSLQALRQGDLAQSEQAKKHIGNLRSAMGLYLEERNRVEKLRKQIAGAVGACGLDLDAARDEIGRRLARLRDAGAGG